MITRVGNTTSPRVVRSIADRHEGTAHPDVIALLREYAEHLEEDSDDNHVCLFNMDLTNHCVVCGKLVDTSVRETVRHSVLTPVRA